MQDADLEKYCILAVDRGATHARQIHPGSVVTAPWVRLKCQYGCPSYDRGYCCPPYTPTPEQTRAVLDSYHRALLFHLELPPAPGRGKTLNKYFETLIDLEIEMFLDGYYKALIFLCGPCGHCKECAKVKGEPCNSRDRARPSMEACGIDVYQTAWNNGFFIKPVRDKSETANIYCLMLAD